VIAVTAGTLVFCRSDSLGVLSECGWCRVANTMHCHKSSIPIASPSSQTHLLASGKFRVWVLECSAVVSFELWLQLDVAGHSGLTQVE